MEQTQITASELAQKTGISKATISRYLSGEFLPKQQKTDAIAHALGVDPAFLIFGKQNNNNRVKAVRIPVLGTVVAGLPIDAVENIIDYEEITPTMAAQGDYFALRIKGKSMEPRICEGDVVIVRKQSDVESGDTAIVLINGNDATVKQVKKSEEGIMLIANNNAVYSPRFYSNKEIQELPVQVIGKVVELRGKL